MKQKTLINYLCLFIAYISVVLILTLSSCEEPAKEKQSVNSARRIDVSWIDENNLNDSEEFTVVVIDSCEYLIAEYDDRSRMISHKGNCKFCAERNKKQLISILDSLTN